MAQNLVPVELPDMVVSSPAAPQVGFTKLYTRRGSLLLRGAAGPAYDAVLDRKLDGFRTDWSKQPITANDTVLSALQKVYLLDLSSYVTQLDLTTALLNLEFPASPSTLDRDIAVSLAAGKTWGTIKNGDVLLKGTSHNDLFRRALVEAILPTYVLPVLTLGQQLLVNSTSAPVRGEVGEVVAVTLSAAYAANDAGTLTTLAIYQDTTLLGSVGSATPLTRTLNVTRSLAGTGFSARAAHAAGALKPVPPANTPDTRSAQIGSVNAPQAANTALTSATTRVEGDYRIFYGPTAAVPTNSAQVRALPSSQLTSEGTQLTLNCGTSLRTFAVALPPGKTILSVVDLDNLNQVVTGDYVASAQSVNDAGGTARTYALYVKIQAVPYLSNHRHLIVLSS